MLPRRTTLGRDTSPGSTTARTEPFLCRVRALFLNLDLQGQRCFALRVEPLALNQDGQRRSTGRSFLLPTGFAVAIQRAPVWAPINTYLLWKSENVASICEAASTANPGVEMLRKCSALTYLGGRQIVIGGKFCCAVRQPRCRVRGGSRLLKLAGRGRGGRCGEAIPWPLGAARGRLKKQTVDYPVALPTGFRAGGRDTIMPGHAALK